MQDRSPAGSDGAPLIVEAKLEPPRVRRGIVDRPRIRAALDASSEAVLTLVGAPVGYGKTTAVRDWCTTGDAALAWVTLDAGDNDPIRLWRYVATAVDRVRPGLGGPALRRLSMAGSPIEDAVDWVMNAISTYARPMTIVLDDLHVVTDAECMSSIDHALLHLPGNARLIVMTRADPALTLARLRGRGQLAELRADDLAFNRSETRELLAMQDRIELDGPELDLLVGRTEGWPAALVLAGLWLKTVDDPSRALAAFGGQQRFVAEYLSSEVLDLLDEDHRSFIEGASVLGEFTSELCDAVLQRSDSKSQLEEVELGNLFVARLERGKWFRMHALLAEYAQTRLAATDPDAVSRIHREAARWLRSRDLWDRAIPHAAAVGDDQLVAQILTDHYLSMIWSGNQRTLVTWVGALPDACVIEYPELAVGAAAAMVLVGGHAIEQRRLLQLADRALAEDRSDANRYVEGAAHLVRALAISDGVERAVLDGRLAVEFAETASDELLTGALAAYARALFYAGAMEEAQAPALRALKHPEIGRRVPSLAHARATLAFVAVARGRLAQARGHAEQARAAAGRISSGRSWLGANASAAVGAVLAAEGSLVDAERELATAAHFFEDEVPTLHHAWLLALLAQVRVRRGRLDQGEAALREALDDLDELPDSGIIAGLADDVKRDLEAARARAGKGDLLEAPSEAEIAVLRLLATDLTSREISERLFLSPNTIRTHIHSLYAKLGVHSRADATARATELGLMDEADSPR